MVVEFIKQLEITLLIIKVTPLFNCILRNGLVSIWKTLTLVFWINNTHLCGKRCLKEITSINLKNLETLISCMFLLAISYKVIYMVVVWVICTYKGINSLNLYLKVMFKRIYNQYYSSLNMIYGKKPLINKSPLFLSPIMELLKQRTC